MHDFFRHIRMWVYNGMIRREKRINEYEKFRNENLSYDSTLNESLSSHHYFHE